MKKGDLIVLGQERFFPKGGTNKEKNEILTMYYCNHDKVSNKDN